MTKDDIAPEDMRQEHGDNVSQNEKQVGQEACKLIAKYESLLKRHDKIVVDIHAVIIEFGRKLQVGRDMYGPGREFGYWVDRRHLNTGTIGSTQQERTACMIIAQLHDVGVPIEEDEGVTSANVGRLDLTECKRTRPTDILKWARQAQRHLFPHLRPRGVTPLNPSTRSPASTTPDLPDDEIPRFSGEAGRPHSTIEELQARVEELEQELKAKGAEPVAASMTLDDLRARVAALLLPLPKDKRRQEVSRIMNEAGLNIHDWVSEMVLGGPRTTKRKQKHADEANPETA